MLKIALTKMIAIRLLEHLQATTDYSPHKDEIEFYFSEQEEPTDETVFALQNSSDDSENDEFQTVFHHYHTYPFHKTPNLTFQIPETNSRHWTS